MTEEKKKQNHFFSIPDHKRNPIPSSVIRSKNKYFRNKKVVEGYAEALAKQIEFMENRQNRYVED